MSLFETIHNIVDWIQNNYKGVLYVYLFVITDIMYMDNSIQILI